MKKILLFVGISLCTVVGLIYFVVPSVPVMAYDGKSKWKQSEFVISTFHAVQGVNNGFSNQLLMKCKEANLNYVELTFTSRPAIDLALDISDVIGLKVIVQDYDLFGGYQDLKVAPTTEKDVIAAINKYGKHPSFAGYYIWDEPYLNQFPLVRKNLDWFAKNDPNRLLFVGVQQSMSPSYNWSNGTFKNYIDSYFKIVDPPMINSNFSYFYVDVDKGKKLEESDIWNDLGYLRKKSLEKNIPFWYYAQLIGNVEKNTTAPENMNADRVRFEVSTLLAYGVKGISYYNTIYSIMDEYGRETYLFDGVKKINAETLQLGKTFVNLRSTLVYHTSTVKADYINKISDSKIVKSAPAGLIFGEYVSPKGGKYVYMSNGSYNLAFNGTVQLKSNYKIYKVNKSNGLVELLSANTNSIPLKLIAGSGELFVFTGINDSAPYNYGNTASSTVSTTSSPKTSASSTVSSSTTSKVNTTSTSISSVTSASSTQTVSSSKVEPVVKPLSGGIIAAIIFALILAGTSGFLIIKKFFIKK